LNKGETNILEKTSAETQMGQIKLQLEQIAQDLEIVRLQFQLLLNTKTVFVPSSTDIKAMRDNAGSLLDTAALSKHPSIQLLTLQKNNAALTTKLAKAKLLPELSLMYNNMSMKGTGSDNVLYSRLHKVSIGAGWELEFLCFSAHKRRKLNQVKLEKALQTTIIKLHCRKLERST
jgi:cobalt-zinc-cadmium resistance protein CzcA